MIIQLYVKTQDGSVVHYLTSRSESRKRAFLGRLASLLQVEKGNNLRYHLKVTYGPDVENWGVFSGETIRSAYEDFTDQDLTKTITAYEYA